MNMVMTILEGHVAQENWADLERAFEAGADPLPSPLVQSYLVQSSTDPTVWRVTTLWRSREALEEYRASVETPGGVLIFRSVGAEPTLSIFDVRVHVSGS